MCSTPSQPPYSLARPDYIFSLPLTIRHPVAGKEEEADALAEQLLRDKDPLLRYGGVYTLALAYVATSNNSAIRRLLHLAVSGARRPPAANDVLVPREMR
jgi:hypothetical protein